MVEPVTEHDAATEHEAGSPEGFVEGAVAEIGSHDRVGAGADENRGLERDRFAVGLAEAAQVDDQLARRDAEAGGFRGR